MKENLIKKFEGVYGAGVRPRVFFAPGRVNLIGEHTDYNGGHVLPCALNFGTRLVVRRREDRRLRFCSENFDNMRVLDASLDSPDYREEAGWINYPMGVIWAFAKRGCQISSGLDVYVSGDIPAGAGLSSSASLEVVTALALRELFSFRELTMTDLALISQYSENQYNGMNCGIMDQFAAAMGRRDMGIFLDTNTLQYQYVDVKLDTAKIVITNSRVKHSLVNSAYNDRRNECETALGELQQVMPIKSLGELDEKTFEKIKPAIKDPIRQKRARHAVYENQRTIRAVTALNRKDLPAFGRLMNESHVSLRDDYEVSCPEIDALVEFAWELPGVIGSRITGGGFGGCTVSIVNNEQVPEFLRTVSRQYRDKTGIEAEMYIAEVGDGAEEL